MPTPEEISQRPPYSVFRESVSVHTKLERARTELLDLSARNRLLNIPRSAKSARIIEIVDERAIEIYRLLVAEGKAFTFLHGREAGNAENTTTAPSIPADEVVELAQPEDNTVDERGIASRHSDTKLQTRLTSQGLQKKLLEFYTDALTLEQEQGVNILYLALGTLQWSDPKDATLFRSAPLILVPVMLERGTAAERFKLRMRPEDISANLSLEAYLERVHKIRLPQADFGDDFDLQSYVRSVTEAVKTKESWKVKEDDIVLGFFSFAKFLMYRDLDPTCWPENAPLTSQPLVRSLLAEGFAVQAELIPEETNVDSILTPAQMTHIVDCDSSQTLAVHEARQGKNIVIQGPPGTGKSQTIANIVAAAVADGKTVLFVAEKMAALDVVKRRLDHAGIGDACLELHSSKANRRLLLMELARTWDLGRPRGTPEDTLHASLLSARDVLNRHVERLHTEHRSARLTPFQVVGSLAQLQAQGVPHAETLLEGATIWDPEERRQRELVLEELRQRIAVIGDPAGHPWRGVILPPLMPSDVSRLALRMEAVLGELRAYLIEMETLSGRMQLEAPRSFAEASNLEAIAFRVATAPALEGPALRSNVWDKPSAVFELLALGQRSEQEQLATETRFEEVLRTDRAVLAAAIDTFVALSSGTTDAQLASVPVLLRTLPELQEAAIALCRMVHGEGSPNTLSAVDELLKAAAQIGSAPAASAAVYLCPLWESEMDRAHDLAEELAKLEQARELVGRQVADSAWHTDFTESRRVLAQHGSSLFRFFSGSWRQHQRHVNSFLSNPKTPLPHKLELLDSLERGRTATATIEREKLFGSELFGPEWQGAKTASAHLLALTTWMRGLRRFPTSQERSLIRNRVAAGANDETLHITIAKLQYKMQEVRSTLMALGSLMVVPADLTALQAALRPVAAAETYLQGLTRTVPLGTAARLLLLRCVEEVLGHRDIIESSRQLGSDAFGKAWCGCESDWLTLEGFARWIVDNNDIRGIAGGVEDRGALPQLASSVRSSREACATNIEALVELLHWDLQTVAHGPQVEQVHLRALEARLAQMLEQREQLSHWTNYVDCMQRTKEIGLRNLSNALADGRIAGEQLLSSFHAAYYEALLQDQLRSFPELARFDGSIHERKIEAFRTLDMQHIRHSSLEVARAHHGHIPPAGGIGAIGILRGEIAKRRGHMPIRQLMSKAAPVVQALKPVMMMSPLSVAQFLSPGQMTFDMLVMDEASQIQPVDALGAIARCRQIVVVGDERQLPPTKFFSKMTGDVNAEEDEDSITEVGDVESVLGLCLARGLPSRMLRWHYRSRHESLIAISNSQFYENKLHIIPSPYSKEAGMGLRFLPVLHGVFESGATGANPIEAKAVAEAVIRHALEHPRLSLGVATFSVRQRKAIQDYLEALRRANPATEAFFANHPTEPFFIKNLENIQGDERDVIFISVGYGRNENGFFAMRFGPLGMDGGERRLNVLISRAKRRCDVFASITDEDIDLERAKGRGVAAFKLFLQYARTGRLNRGQPVAEDPSLNLLVDQVEGFIHQQGFQAHRHVGISGLFLDVAVADPNMPGRYILGIELDGRSYASAQSARDRDRLRETVLVDHGWKLHHVWAMDWLQRPEEQKRLLLQAVYEAREFFAKSQVESTEPVPVSIVAVDRIQVEIEVSLKNKTSETTPYVEANLADVPTYLELHLTPIGVLAKLVRDVVLVEGPVHRDEVIVRIRSAWNLHRSGGRIQSVIDEAIRQAVGQGISTEAGFLCVAGPEIIPRDRSLVQSPGLRQVDMLPPTEIDAAILHVLHENLGALPEQLSHAVARVLGFKATSAQFRTMIESRVMGLSALGKIAEHNGMIMAS